MPVYQSLENCPYHSYWIWNSSTPSGNFAFQNIKNLGGEIVTMRWNDF